mgnify:CR=1 FL=1
MVQVDSGTLFFAAIFTNNILLTNFLGLCPFLAISRQIRSALGLGAAVVFVMTATAGLNHLVYYRVLLPLGLELWEMRPVLLDRAALHPARALASVSAVLVMFGGFVLRYVFVLAGQMSSFE